MYLIIVLFNNCNIFLLSLQQLPKKRRRETRATHSDRLRRFIEEKEKNTCHIS